MRRAILLATGLVALLVLLSSSVALANTAPTADNFQSASSVVDRQADWYSDTTDNVKITFYVTDPDGVAGTNRVNENCITLVKLSVRDNNGVDNLFSGAVTDNSQVGSTDHYKFVYNLDPDNTLPDDNLGQTQIKAYVEDNAGASDTIDFTTENAPTAEDIDTSLSLPDYIVNNEGITVSGTAEMLGGTLSLDNIRINDEYVGIENGTPEENWEISFQVTDTPNVTSTLRVQMLDTGSPAIDGQVSTTYQVEPGEEIGGTPTFPAGKLSVSVSLGIIRNGRFVPRSSFSPGETVAVKATVTRDGSPVLGASVSARFKGTTIILKPSGDGTYLGTFTISKSVTQGQHLVRVKASEGGQSDTGSSSLSVGKGGAPIQTWIPVLVVVLIAIALYCYERR